MWKYFIGSTIAMVIGVMGFLGTMSKILGGSQMVVDGKITAQENSLEQDRYWENRSFQWGLFVVFGTLAYRSRKKVKLGLVSDKFLRRLFEGVCLGLVVMLVLLQNDLILLMYYDPVPNVIIPIWIFVAYLIVLFKKTNLSEDLTTGNSGTDSD